jgi:hypothetical protein
VYRNECGLPCECSLPKRLQSSAGNRSDLLPEDYLALKHTDDPAPTARLSRTIAPMPDDKRPKHEWSFAELDKDALEREAKGAFDHSFRVPERVRLAHYLALKHTDDPAPTARLSRTIAPMPDDKRPKHVPAKDLHLLGKAEPLHAGEGIQRLGEEHHDLQVPTASTPICCPKTTSP